MSLRALVVIFVITSVCAKKRRNYDSDEEHGDDVTSSPVMDRLVLNLASAFVKSILPEVEQASIPISSELRRAPQSQNLFDQTTIGRSGAYSSILGEQDSPSTLHGTDGALFGKERSPSTTFPDLFALASSGQAPFGFANHQQQPFSRIASLNLATLNKARNERYLADLRRHQRELQQYTANQMYFLDEQRRYQEAMLDHQATAAVMAVR
ncbi:unnamed protein product [Toxocara canis]|uniref:Uncharacterized protein n=1 Tax=Toxocara canis TaxID=6265 RepID=A0A183VBQ9_TOXCA|nr:unnamed protein product [Toxocara canis]